MLTEFCLRPFNYLVNYLVLLSQILPLLDTISNGKRFKKKRKNGKKIGKKMVGKKMETPSIFLFFNA